MADDVLVWDAIDDALYAKVNEARERYDLGPTKENRKARQEALKALADWVLRRKLPGDFH